MRVLILVPSSNWLKIPTFTLPSIYSVKTRVPYLLPHHNPDVGPVVIPTTDGITAGLRG